MKKKLKITIAFLLLSFLFLGVAFLGDPITKHLAKDGTQKYIDGNFDESFVIQDVAFNFKTGDYEATVAKEDSQDIYFTVSTSRLGKVQWDNYGEVLETKITVFDRLSDEYRGIVQEALGEIDGIQTDAYLAFNEGDKHRITSIQPEFDAVYDITNLGKEGGYVTIYPNNKTPDYKELAGQLKTVKERLDKEGIGVVVVNVYFEDKDKTKDIYAFPAELIEKENLEERLEIFSKKPNE